MLDWLSCQTCYLLEIKILLLYCGHKRRRPASLHEVIMVLDRTELT